MTEQQIHLPSSSMEIEPHAAIAVELKNPEGVQGGVRQSVLQRIWWDRSLDRCMFLGTDLRSLSLHLLISREALNSFMVTLDPHDYEKIFCKMSDSWYWTPPSPKPCILTFPCCHFGAVSQSYLRCCLPGCSPHFAPKLNSQLSSCTSFFSWHW